MKNNKIFKVKGYIHFDYKKNNYKKIISYIKNNKCVERHAFFPFIHYTDERKKFNGLECKLKTREIFYASHIDRYIYQYYGYLLNTKYNKKSKELGINNATIAYRTNLHKNNIHFSQEVIKYLQKQSEAFIIVSDFSKFFDTLNHKYLKDNVKLIIESDYIPNDYYKILKSICKFSYIEVEDIKKELQIEDTKKVKMDRWFEINQFRRFKKDFLKVNKEEYGIIQGSPISAVMSNIYMLEFDRKMNNLITSNNGIYRRYSDDIFIAIPNIKRGQELYKQIEDLVNAIPNLVLSENKTKYFILKNNSITELEKDKFNDKKSNTIINYLGFSYDGKKVRIIEKTVSKYYTKMYARVKTINKYSKKLNKNIGRRTIYKQYSHLGANSKEAKKGNFLSYVNRAKSIFGEEADFDKQLKNSWKNLNKKLENY